MNLMDMLSAEQSLNPDTITEPFYDTLRQPEMPEKTENTVYYLPCEMTTLQKDMSEAVVQIFAGLLESQIVKRKQRTSINTLLESSSLLEYSESLIVESLLIMYDQLVTISMHPSLLVDHFISKGLLLLSPKDRLLDLSGKMRLFNELVDLLTEKQEAGAFLWDYNLFVVARSVKELELIEGLILGKKLEYYNLSSGKLYEENFSLSKFKKESSVDDLPNPEMWRKQRHHRRRGHGPKLKPKHKLILHLISSSQLYGSYHFDGLLDLVFSFDVELKLSSASLDLLRRSNRASLKFALHALSLAPVFIPIQIFSIEHIGRVLAPPDRSFSNTREEDDWRLKVLKTFIINRSHLFVPLKDEKCLVNHAQFFQELGDWLLKWDAIVPPLCLTTLEKYSEQISLDTEDAKMISSTKENHLMALSTTFMPLSKEIKCDFAANSGYKEEICYSTLKRELAFYLNKRAEQVEALIADGLNKVLPDLRQSETSRQAQMDSFEDQVNNSYRKLRKLNELLPSVDKKFNRVETEHQNMQAQNTETKNLLVHIKDVTSTKTEDEIAALAEAHCNLLKELQKEKERLEEDYKVLTDESERAREVYQLLSMEAVKLSSSLNSALEKQKKLGEKLDGPGMRQLPNLVKKDELDMYEDKLRRIRAESNLMNLLLNSRFDRCVKERASSMELANLSNSRLINRGSRSSTPFMN